MVSCSSGAHRWRAEVIILLAIATLAVTAHQAVTASMNRGQPQLSSVTPDLYSSTPGRARFQRLPIPPEPHGDSAWVTVCRQPSGTDTRCIETASACWPHSLPPWPRDTARALPYSSAQSGDNITPVPAALTSHRLGRSFGSNQGPSRSSLTS